ncbi:MAG: hypothetical protein WC488_00480 [Candidatus Micrarchaeia archaeon]
MDAKRSLTRKDPGTYREGYNSTPKHGPLILHPLLDSMLAVNPAQFISRKIDETLVKIPGALKTDQPIWTFEVVVFPKPYGAFEKGVDIIDPITGWIFPWMQIPGSAFGVKGIALQFIPSLSGSGEGTVVSPRNSKAIITVEDFIQGAMGEGAVHPGSRLATVKAATGNQLRTLKRPPTEGIRIATRCAFDWNLISLADHPDKERFWLVFLQPIAKSMVPESSEQKPPDSTSSRIPKRVDIQPDSEVEVLMHGLKEVLGK